MSIMRDEFARGEKVLRTDTIAAKHKKNTVSFKKNVLSQFLWTLKDVFRGNRVSGRPGLSVWWNLVVCGRGFFLCARSISVGVCSFGAAVSGNSCCGGAVG